MKLALEDTVRGANREAGIAVLSICTGHRSGHQNGPRRGRLRLLWALCTTVLVAGSLKNHAGEMDRKQDDPVGQVVTAGAEDREEALSRLETAGRQVGETVEGLVQFVADPSVPIDLRSRAVVALGEAGLRDEEQATRLFQVLGDPTVDDELRWTLLMTFGDRPQWRIQGRPFLVSILADPGQSGLLRRQALFGLRESLDDQAVAEVLMSILQRTQEDAVLRDAILETIRLTGASWPGMVKVLAERATDATEAANFRGKALRVLEAWKAGAGEALPILVEGVLDSSSEPAIRLQIVEVIGRIGALGPLASVLGPVVLRSNERPELREAIALLPGLDAKLMPGSAAEWLAVMKDGSLPPAVHQLALRVVGQRGGEQSDQELLGICLEWLRDPGEAVRLRLEAARYLQLLGPELESARLSLAEILVDPSQPDTLREQIGTIFVEIARSWLTPAERLTRPELLLRMAAVEDVLAWMDEAALSSTTGRKQREAVRQVQAVLKREWHARRWDRVVWWAGQHPWAATGIALVGLAGLGALIQGLSRFQLIRSVRPPVQAAEAVAPSTPVLGQALQDCLGQVLAPDNPNRSEAVEQLGGFGPELESAVPSLVEVLNNREQELDLRFAALTVLGLAGPLAGPAQTVLLGILGDLREPVFLRLKSLEVLDVLMGREAALSNELAKRLVEPREAVLLRVKAGQCLCARSACLPEWREAFQDLVQHSESTELAALARQLLGKLES